MVIVLTSKTELMIKDNLCSRKDNKHNFWHHDFYTDMKGSILLIPDCRQDLQIHVATHSILSTYMH